MMASAIRTIFMCAVVAVVTWAALSSFGGLERDKADAATSTVVICVADRWTTGATPQQATVLVDLGWATFGACP